MAQKPTRFSKRELGFAAAMGVVAAGGIALIVYDDDFQGDRRIMQADPSANGQMVYQLESFNQVASVGPQDVKIALGDSFSVRAEGPGDALDGLEVVVEQGSLMIRLRDEALSFDRPQFENVTLLITMPVVDRVSLSGSGDMSVDRVESALFTASVEGSGEIEVGELAVGQAELVLAGSGDMKLGGSVQDLRLEINGSGELDASGLEATSATITINGSGEAALDVARQAQVTINGSGDVEITGPAVCSVAINGSGDVSCEGSAS
jgi:hypothetical protein